ncbi:MAG: hypothetical protein SFT90_00380 [Rickettsiales bacterium]|nr:hypothetical protein [Rickettsiales bacterium]
MPIYAVIYLFLFFLFAFSTTYMHFEEGRGAIYVIPEAISYVFLLSFILIYFYQDKFSLSLPVVISMFLYSLLWDIYSFRQDIQVAKNQFGIRGRELTFYSSIAIIFSIPPYLAGLGIIF